MNKLNAVLTLPLALMLAAGCGGDAKKDDKAADKKEAKADDKGAEKAEAAPPPEEKAEPAPAPAPVEASPEMTGFLGKFDGKSASVEAALKELGAEGLDSKDMGMYDLTDPKVVAREGDCYDFEAGAGMTIRTYRVCWEGGKIKSVEDKGMR
jgi:hypothetical protein